MRRSNAKVSTKAKARQNVFDSPLNANSSRKKRRANSLGFNNNNNNDNNEASDSDSDDAVVFGNCVDVSSRYDRLGRIGEGTYGVVYKARDKESGRVVALKRCLPHHQDSDGFPVTTLREIQALRMCTKHANIIQLEHVGVSETGIFLVFEYCEHDLADLIDKYYQRHQKSPFVPAAVKTLMSQLLQAVQHMHSLNLIHRDIKVSNLLYTVNGTLKLADFGLSRPFAGQYNVGRTTTSAASTINNGVLLTPKVASLWYRPPELLLGLPQYTQAIDMWAVGCVMAELFSGKPLFNGRSEIDQLSRMSESLGIPTLADWPDYHVHAPPLLIAAVQTDPQAPVSLPLSSLLLVNNMPAAAAMLMVNPVNPLLYNCYPMRILEDFSYVTPATLTLLLSLLTYNPSRRITASQALRSTYFDELPVPLTPAQMPRFPNYTLENK